MEGKGETKLKKVSSYIMKKMSDMLKSGKTPSFTIITKLDDPDAIGAERVALYGCKFDKMILADWERKRCRRNLTALHLKTGNCLTLQSRRKDMENNLINILMETIRKSWREISKTDN